ncbi:uncharacterized protein At1g04910-like isoform X2 [Asparagus officinalis]|uniref:uncharacterized protein At1g04910-like isoform X2 n=1 Tax=Asparagus officinalis TaxID=4686 RepID=UPI00098E451D|nr:uncharacterized protein At1g04910-like isoform X2 [Asparagus officinalis]
MATADEVPSSSSTTRSRPSSPRISSPPSSPFDQQRPLWPRRKRGGGGGGRRRRSRSFAVWIAIVGFFVLMNWWMFSRLQNYRVHSKSEEISTAIAAADATSSDILQGDSIKYQKSRRPHKPMYTRLLALAAHALAEAESKPEPRDTWKETLTSASSWVPCADRRGWKSFDGNNGYILVSANGGISQQRVAICNAVAISRLLNATLVLPKFLHSNVWKDESQFSAIYQEDHFISVLKADIQIVKELPVELRSLDLEAIGSLVTDNEVMKEAKPSFYLKKVLPILLKNRVVHFTGFGNRLAFDPIPHELQRLRCRCNFHALQFVESIQKGGALLIQRMRRHRSLPRSLEQNLLGPFAVESNTKGEKDKLTSAPRYLAMHVRFEIDMVAYSMCYFGGGKEEEEELEAYRAVHFPALTLLKKSSRIPPASVLRFDGKCPLTPEEAVLMLAALGFKRKTRVYIAGADIYGGKSRMAALKSLYPKLTTKESLLSSSEIEPFRNSSSQES